MPYNIVRPGMTSWSTKTGILTDTDWLSRLFRGCSYINAAPDSDAKISIVPVDYMAMTIVKIALGKLEVVKTEYNIFNFPPIYFQGMLRLVAMAANDVIYIGDPVKDASFVQGFRDIYNTVSQSVWNDVVATKLSTVKRGSHEEEVLSGLRMFHGGVPSEGSRFSPNRTLSCPIEYPSINQKYMKIMVMNNKL